MAGPTAVGKSSVAVEVALPQCEIVSADSVQIYRYLDIGSGKVTQDEMMGIPHHLIDIIDPDEPYSAGKYCTDAYDICQKLEDKNKIPLFVGGTGLYIDSFFKGIADIPEIESSVRDALYDDLNKYGQNHLYEELKTCDFEFASGIHVNDKQRILRGLEVYRGTKKPLSSYYKETKGYESQDTLYLGLQLERKEIIQRINQRVDKMLALGLIDEVELLKKRGYSSDLPAMKTIGYLQINKYLNGFCTKEEAIDEIKIETRRYAKRQMTWFRRNKKCIWSDPNDTDKIKKTIIGWFESITTKYI